MVTAPITGKEPHMHVLNRRLSSACIAATAALLLATSPLAAQTVPARTLTIAGNAEVHSAPDAALISAGVVTESDTAAAALKANSVAVAKVVDVIRMSGVEAKDLQTAGLALDARMYRPDKPSATDKPRIIGYTAANQLTVRVRDLGKLGDLLDKVAAAGANRIDGIQFIISDQEGLLDEARRKAVADAKAKADLYAQAAGVTLGKLMSLTEETAAPAPRPMGRAMAASPAASIPVPIEAGEMTLSVRLRVTWSLAD
jgi:uncharacterized protein YggE